MWPWRRRLANVLLLPTRESGCRTAPSRSLSTSAQTSARQPARSPSVRDRQRHEERMKARQTGTVQPRAPRDFQAVQETPGEPLRPVATQLEIALKYAYRRGLISKEMLSDFKADVPPQEICSKYPTEHSTLRNLAKALIQGHDSSVFDTSQKILIALSELKDSEATLIITQLTIKAKIIGHPSLAATRQHIQELAASGDVVAMAFEAKIHHLRGDTHKGDKIYDRILGLKDPDLTSANELLEPFHFGDIWNERAASLLGAHDYVRAKEALTTAALQYGVPEALYQLAWRYEELDDPQYESHMIDAAASGIVKAAFQLGVLYYKQAQGSIPPPPKALLQDATSGHSRYIGGGGKSEDLSLFSTTSDPAIQKRNLAADWFSIAAAADFSVDALIYLAILYRSGDKHQAGLQTLEKAREMISAQSASKYGKRWKEDRIKKKTVDWLISNWKTTDDLMRFDIDALNRIVA